jgi:hypothetical protein
MAGVFVRIAFIWLLLFMAFQPLLGHLDYMLYVVVKSNAEYAAQKAAPDGMLTQAVRDAVIENLVAVGFKEEDISITTNATSPLPRGDELVVEIRAPRIPLFVMNLSGESLPTQYFGKAYITSEYIP